MNREETIQKTIQVLKKNNFLVNNFLQSNSCFDIVAKKEENTLLIKVYENIDSFRNEQGDELKKLSKVINANCIIIGSKTKVFELENNTVYFRQDIPAVNVYTFEKSINSQEPIVRHFKGKDIVDIDSEKLSLLRKEMDLSLKELAEKLGVATETLYRYEKGASTSLETAQKMENELKNTLAKKVDIFKKNYNEDVIDDLPSEDLLEKMHDIGLRMALFSHSPFDAYGQKEKLFISSGKGKLDLPKKAFELKKISTVVDTDSILITKEYKYKSINGIPIIQEHDFDTISKPKDIRKFLDEREDD